MVIRNYCSINMCAAVLASFVRKLSVCVTSTYMVRAKRINSAWRQSRFIYFNQFKKDKKVRLFEGAEGYADGEQLRDFISVEDVINVNLFFHDHPERSGIYNVGTGACQTFNDVAVATVNTCRAQQGQSALTIGRNSRTRVSSNTLHFPKRCVANIKASRKPIIAHCARPVTTLRFSRSNKVSTRYMAPIGKRKTRCLIRRGDYSDIAVLVSIVSRCVVAMTSINYLLRE